VPWWEGAVAYLILVPALIVLVMGLPLFLSLWSCVGSDNAACLGVDELVASAGNPGAVINAAAGCYLLAVVAAITVQLLVGRLHFVLVWTLALCVLGLSALGYAIISGTIGTPWGQLYQDIAAPLIGTG
jgi:hypothetical protein